MLWVRLPANSGIGAAAKAGHYRPDCSRRSDRCVGIAAASVCRPPIALATFDDILAEPFCCHHPRAAEYDQLDVDGHLPLTASKSGYTSASLFSVEVHAGGAKALPIELQGEHRRSRARGSLTTAPLPAVNLRTTASGQSTIECPTH